MKPIAALATLLLAGCSYAAELSPRLLRLIGADARLVVGADLDRQGSSVLDRFFPSCAALGTDTTRQTLRIERETADGSAALTVLIGAASPRKFTTLDTNISVAGDPDAVREAQRRWALEEPPSPMAAKARRLAESYDNWFLIRKPFSVVATAPLLKYSQALIDAVEELSGGIRFGAVNELYLEAVFRDPQDASAVATLARWLPAILQLQSPDTAPGILVGAIEDFKAYAYGQRASITLRIPEDKAKSLLEAQGPRPVVE